MAGYIDWARQEGLKEILSFLQSKLREYQGGKRTCLEGLQCTAMVLGSLTIGLNAIGVLQSPDPPYVGFQLRKLTNRLKGIEIHNYCQISDSYGGCAGLKNELLAKIDYEVNFVRRLNLQDFKNVL